MNYHLSNYRYVRTHGASLDDKSDDFCVIDMSTGWTPATNVKEWCPEDNRLKGFDAVVRSDCRPLQA